MIRIERLFENLFDDRQISRAELLDFTQDHLGRLAQQNAGGRWAILLAETADAYEAMEGQVDQEFTRLAVQKARTQRKTEHISKIKEEVSRLSKLVAYEYGERSAVWEEFFPNGLREWHRAREAEIEPLLTRVMDATANNLPDKEDLINDLHATWLRLRRDASEGRAGTTQSAQDRQEAALALQLQLTRNVHLLAAEFPGQPDRANDFFDQSRLENRDLNGDDDEVEGDPSSNPPTEQGGVQESP